MRLIAWLIFGAATLPAAESCSECHAGIHVRQTHSRHSQALRPILQTPLASILQGSSVTEAGGLVRYFYAPSGTALAVTAQRDETDSFTAALQWTFGAGSVGHTAVGRVGGRYFEHRISYFTEPGRASLTPGQPAATPATAKDALGLVQSSEDAFRCFHCHATGVEKNEAGPDLSNAEPGIQCERCHGPGKAHIDAAKAGRPQPEIRKAIFSPGHLAARAVVEFCGQCHRTPKPGQVSSMPELDDPLSVRYQPFGLMASRCFIASKQLSCLTCHDPHDNARRADDAFYTAKCVACHREPVKRGAQCKRASKQDCLPCHMQRATPAPYLTFTDHRIRVY